MLVSNMQPTSRLSEFAVLMGWCTQLLAPSRLAGVRLK